jgi:hypothetical protein
MTRAVAVRIPLNISFIAQASLVSRIARILFSLFCVSFLVASIGNAVAVAAWLCRFARATSEIFGSIRKPFAAFRATFRACSQIFTLNALLVAVSRASAIFTIAFIAAILETMEFGHWKNLTARRATFEPIREYLSGMLSLSNRVAASAYPALRLKLLNRQILPTIAAQNEGEGDIQHIAPRNANSHGSWWSGGTSAAFPVAIGRPPLNILPQIKGDCYV